MFATALPLLISQATDNKSAVIDFFISTNLRLSLIYKLAAFQEPHYQPPWNGWGKQP
jgi:hypothetical protein